MTERSAAAELADMINGYQLTHAVSIVAELGIADRLKDGPRTSDELAAATGSHAPTLYRVLRALAAAGLFHEGAERTFTLTSRGQPLRTDVSDSVRPMALVVGRPYYRQAWDHLRDSVRTGENAFRHTFGTGLWQYRAERPDESALFDDMMTTNSRRIIADVLAAYDFSGFATVMDVGGGHGALLAAVLSQNPAQAGILFDQPHVVAGAPDVLGASGVAERCRIVGGDFFHAVPEGADAILMKWILHDWDDEACMTILAACRKALGPDGKLLVLERIIAPANEGREAKFADLGMLALPGGLERTAEEFATLFAEAGFRLERIVPAGARTNVIEAAPA